MTGVRGGLSGAGPRTAAAGTALVQRTCRVCAQAQLADVDDREALVRKQEAEQKLAAERMQQELDAIGREKRILDRDRAELQVLQLDLASTW
jgi:hypothetical protein